MSCALVLSGGGVAGIAWETGVLLGLRDAGCALLDRCDLVIGTSAGAVVGAQVLAGVDLDVLYARQLDPMHQEIAAEFDLERLMEIFGDLASGTPLDTAARQRIGTIASAAPTVPETARRAVIEWRLPSHAWPEVALRVTAVDIGSGELRVFDRSSGIPLVDAVAASCAVPGIWPPVTIGDRRFMDGGVASVANAALATGAAQVVILAPMAGPALASTDAEIETLRGAGATVVLVAADDDDAAAVMSANPLDPATRRPSAEHGRRQGRLAAAGVVAALGAPPVS